MDGEIHKYSPKDDFLKTLSVKQMIGAIAIPKNGHFAGALKNGFGFTGRNSGFVSLIANPEPLLPGNRFKPITGKG